MARRQIDLDAPPEMVSYNMLIHGIPGAGKTHLLGDFLREEARRGDVRFLNIAGEDGFLSIANLGLGPIGETVETYKDFREALAEYARKSLQAVALDSFHRFCDLVMTDMFGEKLPQGGDNKQNEWSLYHFRMRNESDMLRQLARRVLTSALSDRYMDPVTGEAARINPDLPGAQSRLALGRFDFIGYIEAKAMGPGRVKRTLMLTPNAKIITRQRLPRPITNDLDIPDGGGGYANFLTAVNAAMTPVVKKEAA